MKTDDTQNRFGLEALEPRLLLCGEQPLHSLAASPIGDFAETAIAQERFEPSNQAQQTIAYDPAAQLGQIFAGPSEDLAASGTEEPTAATPTTPEDVANVTEATDVGETALVRPIQPTAEPDLQPAGSQPETSNPIIEQLTETLRVPNGPPSIYGLNVEQALTDVEVDTALGWIKALGLAIGKVSLAEPTSSFATLKFPLPFSSGLEVSHALDFPKAFEEKILSQLVNAELISVIQPLEADSPDSIRLAHMGQLTGNAAFSLQIGDNASVSVTVLAASTDGTDGTAVNSSLDDLVADFNAAFEITTLPSEFHPSFTFLSEVIEAKLDPLGNLVIALKQDARTFRTKLTIPDAENPMITQLGFMNNQPGTETPRFESLQGLADMLSQILDPDGTGPEPPFDVEFNFDPATELVTMRVEFSGYELTKAAPFNVDPDLRALGPVADLQASGTLNFGTNIGMSFTLGFDLNAKTVPELVTMPFTPPPSNGRLTADARFRLEFGGDITGTTDELTLNVDGTNENLDNLVDDLNGLFGRTPFQGSMLNTNVITRREGTRIVLAVQESRLGEINSLRIIANNDDPIVTEVGFSNEMVARSELKGLFLDFPNETDGFSGSLTISSDNPDTAPEEQLQASARFSSFEILATGTAQGTAQLSLGLKNPDDSTGTSKRVTLDQLFANLDPDKIGNLIDAPAFSGSFNLDLAVTSIQPDLVPIPPGTEININIPDLPAFFTRGPVVEFDGGPDVPNATIRVRLPELGALPNFSCLGFLDILAGLDSLSDTLEGMRGFSFLDADLPLIGTSLGGILDFAGTFARMVDGLRQGDVKTIKNLEGDIEDLLEVSRDLITLSVEHTNDPVTMGGGAGSRATATFNPPGLNNAIAFESGVPGSDRNGITIRFIDDDVDDDDDNPILTEGTDDARALYDESARILTIYFNSGHTTANRVNELTLPVSAGLTSRLDNTDADDGVNHGTGTISTTALKLSLNYSLSYGKTLPLHFDLGSLAELIGNPTAQRLLEGVSEIVQVEAAGTLNVTARATLQLNFGIDVSNPCEFVPFLDDTTNLTLNAKVLGTNLHFGIGVGNIEGLSVENGTVTLDADGNPATVDDATFRVGLKDNNGDGRHYFRASESFFDAANMEVTLTAGANATLPIFLFGIPLDGTGDTHPEGGDGYPDNQLVVNIPVLGDVFEGIEGSVTIITPDFSALFSQINICDLITNPGPLLDGLDLLLKTIQDGLDSKFASKLPLVGDQLGKAANFIQGFREGLLANIRTKLAEGSGDPIALVKQAIFEVLGPPGLNLLVKVNNDGQLIDTNGVLLAAGVDPVPITDFNDVIIHHEICSGPNAEVTFLLRLFKTMKLVDATENPINFDIGLDGLGLKVNGNVEVQLGFDFKLYFGLSSKDKFFFDTSAPLSDPELQIFLNVTVENLDAEGELLFLKLHVTDESDGKDATGNPRKDTSLGGAFVVDLKDPNDRLTFADLGWSGLKFEDLIDANLVGTADVHLDLEVSFGDDAAFPRLLAEFDLDWDFPDPRVTGVRIGFNNVQLDLGSFLSKFVQPIFREIRKVTEPIDPLVDLLTFRLPIISDLAGEDFTLLDLARAFGFINQSTYDFIGAITTIIDIVNNVRLEEGTLLIPMGDLSLARDLRGNLNPTIPALPSLNLDALSHKINTSSNTEFRESASTFVQRLKDLKTFRFPFLENPSELLQLFLGRSVTMIEWHMPVLEFEFSYTQRFPIYPPLFARFRGSIGAKIDLTFGYDTLGLRQFFGSRERDAADLLNGFFVKDVDNSGQDIPELTLNGSLTAGASINIAPVEAGVEGGIFATVEFNLNDPDDDGKVRIKELIELAKTDLRCIFDIHGEITAGLEAFLTADLFLLEINERWRLAEVTLIEFDLACPMPVLANYVDDAGVVQPPPGDADPPRTLRLNMGPNAGARVNGDTSDGDENFTVQSIPSRVGEGESVRVKWNGHSQDFHHVSRIVADGGQGNDVIDLRGVPVRAKINGGNGQDTLYASDADYFADDDRLNGDAGNDTLIGSDFKDRLIGGDGSDTLTGNAGNDQLFGMTGSDILIGGDGDDHLDGGEGADTLSGNNGDDTILGGGGNDVMQGHDGIDTMDGGRGSDTMLGGRANDDMIGGDGDDFMDGGAGDDLMLGDNGTFERVSLNFMDIAGTGFDTMAGGPGNDILFGAGGDDALFGGTFIEDGTTKVTEPDGVDFLDGGGGNDAIFADDAHAPPGERFPAATIKGTVWFDEDPPDSEGQVIPANSLHDSNEKGVAGIKVELYKVVEGAETLVATRRTNAKGEYVFTGLLPDIQYYLKFDAPGTLIFTTPNQSLADGSVDDAIDSDADPVTGRTTTFTLEPGENDDTWDAGLQGTQVLITIENVTVAEGNAGTTSVVFTVSLSKASTEIVTVCYMTAENTEEPKAAPGQDFVVNSWTLTFEPGITSQTIIVLVKGDNMHELNETFLVTLQDPYNATFDGGGTIAGIGTIIDDDPVPGITIGDGRVPVDDDGVLENHEIFAEQAEAGLDAALEPFFGALHFTVRLSNPSYQRITADWLTADLPRFDANGNRLLDTALGGGFAAGVDYLESHDTVNFEPGDIEKTIIIYVVNDQLNEYDERFEVRISLPCEAPSNTATIADDVAVGTILGSFRNEAGQITYDDLLPKVRITPAAPTVNEGENAHFTIELLQESGRIITVNYATARGTALARGTGLEEMDFGYQSGTLYFDPDDPDDSIQDIAVVVLEDETIEGDEYFFVNLLSATNAEIQGNHAVVTIHDDDGLARAADPVTSQLSEQSYTARGDVRTVTGTALRTDGRFEPAGADAQAINAIGCPPVTPPLYLRGFVFQDANGNGIFDAETEEGIEGVRVWMRDNAGILLAEPRTATTRTEGNFRWNYEARVSFAFPEFRVEVDEGTVFGGNGVLTTNNNPQNSLVTSGDVVLIGGERTFRLNAMGFQVAPVVAIPGPLILTGAGTNNDTLYGGPGNDILNGGSGDDHMVGGHWLGPGCVDCDGGLGYNADLERDIATGRISVNTTSLRFGSIGNRVWLELGVEDGSQTFAEDGVEAVKVNLFDAAYNLIATAFTDANGNYWFTDLAPCDYYVQFIAPEGYRFTTADSGVTDFDDSDADPITGLATRAVTVHGNDSIAFVDAGVVPLPATHPGLPWNVQFQNVNYNVLENERKAIITLSVTEGSPEPVAVYWTRQLGPIVVVGTRPATAGVDYAGIYEEGTYPPRGILSFGNGEKTRQFEIAIFEDDINEGYEEVSLMLANPTGGPINGNRPTALLLIFDAPCPDDDVLLGEDGNDTMLGDYGFINSAGAVTLLNGMGNDKLIGGDGEDELYGQGGNDRLEGGEGTDNLDGGSENDAYVFDGDLNQGADTIVEQNGPVGGIDMIDLSPTATRDAMLDLSTPGRQTVTSTPAGGLLLQITLPADNVIEDVIGGRGNDRLIGNDLDNILEGGPGNDILIGAGGNDILKGGQGNDTYTLDADAPLGHDTIKEETDGGIDLIDFSQTGLGIGLDLSEAGSQVVNPNLSLRLSHGDVIENVFGGTGNDILFGNRLDNVIKGGLGNDTMDGGDPTDGTDDNDFLLEDRPGVTLRSEIRGGILVGILAIGAEEDTFAPGTFESVHLKGRDSDLAAEWDTLDASSFTGTVILEGFAGNDTLKGGSGLNILIGGPGNDTIDGSRGIDRIIESRDADLTLTDVQLRIGAVAETDTFIGVIEEAWLTGGESANTIDAHEFGGSVRLTGGSGNDTLIGGPGNDTFIFDADATLGMDTLTGNGGLDTLDFTGTSTDVAVDLSVIYDVLNPETTTQAVVAAKLSLQLTDALESVIGGDGNDALTGNDLANVFVGGLGNDVLTGGSGADSLDGGEGTDQLKESRDANMTLTQETLTIGGETDALLGFETAALTGGDGPNILDASDFPGTVILDGLGGNDALTGGSGNDILIGGAGDDTMDGGPGDDTYLFDADTLISSAAVGDTINELIAGDIDTLNFSLTTDLAVAINLSRAVRQQVNVNLWLRLSAGNVIENVIGGSWIDTNPNTHSGDVITGNSLNNVLIGGPGHDKLSGGGSIDEGIDFLVGGEGNDTYLFDADADLGRVRIYEAVGAEGGIDTLDFSQTRLAVTIDLSDGGEQRVNDDLILYLTTCSGMENVIGGSGANTITGNSLDNALTSGDQRDILIGGDGDDTLEGREGDDELRGGRGNDTYVFDLDTDPGADAIFEPAVDGGFDTWDFSLTTELGIEIDLQVSDPVKAIEKLIGSSGDDILTGNDLDNVLIGGAGRDILVGGLGNDTLEGGEGADTLRGGRGNDTYVFDLDTDPGADAIFEPAVDGGFDTWDFSLTTELGIEIDLQVSDPVRAIEKLIGSSGDDILTGNDLDNVLIGGPGDDILVGGHGNDTLVGGDGDDVLTGTEGDDELRGGRGNDTYVFDLDTDPGADAIFEPAVDGGFDTWDFSLTTELGIEIDLQVSDPVKAIEKLIGSSGDDILTGNDLDNVLIGGPGNDTLVGGLGNDELQGGPENDAYVFADNWGTDTAIEGPAEGADTMDFSAVTANLTFAVAGSITVTAGANTATHTGDAIETLIGGSASDTFNITPSANTALTVDGRDGLLDVLNFDAGGLSVIHDEATRTITAAGRQPVTYLNFETVNINNAAAGLASLGALRELIGLQASLLAEGKLAELENAANPQTENLAPQPPAWLSTDISRSPPQWLFPAAATPSPWSRAVGESNTGDETSGLFGADDSQNQLRPQKRFRVNSAALQLDTRKNLNAKAGVL